MRISPRRLDLLTGPLLAAGAFLVYLRTMAPGVGTEDPGEIATVLDTMGIAHPTGYPLYTMLGALFVQLPVGDAGIWRMNLFGAVLTAISVFLFHGTFRFLFSERGRSLFVWRGTAPDPATDRAGAIASTTVFAFSAIFWFEAVSVEVYAMHLVFLAVVCRLFLVALDAFVRSTRNASRTWNVFAYATGLSFAHHMMTVLLAPAFLWLFFRVHGFGRTAWTRIAIAAPLFLLGLSAYLYLPIRSASNPLINWGEPTTPLAFWKHVTAAQYGEQMFSSMEVAVRKLNGFMAELPADFSWPALALTAVGLAILACRSIRLLVFSALVFAVGLFYAVNYAFDDPNFHLHPHFMISLWAGITVAAVWNLAGGVWGGALRAACLVAVLSVPVSNFPVMDKSRDTLVHDYTRNVFESLDSGAVLFSNEYERFGSPAFYFQNVERFREDVAVLDIILLGNPWYYGYLEQRVPWLMELARPEITAFRVEMDRFFSGREAMPDSAALRAGLAAMFTAIVENARADGRPVYVTAGINPAMIERYQHAPTGMVFRLLAPDDTTRVPLREPRFAPLPPHNRLTPTVRSDYAQSYAYQGAYLAQLGETSRAIEFLHKALEILPEFPDAEAYLRELRGRDAVPTPE